MSLPELECPRLRLRAFQESDIRELHQLWINPEVRKYLWDDQLISRELAEETVQASLLSAETEGLGMWMVFKKDTGSFAGFCGFRRIPGSSEVELLYGLWPDFWGEGLATLTVWLRVPMPRTPPRFDSCAVWKWLLLRVASMVSLAHNITSSAEQLSPSVASGTGSGDR